MAYDESSYRRRDPSGTDPGGSGGLREDASFGAEVGFGPASGYQTGSYPVANEYREPEPMESTQRRGLSSAALGDVFDDPTHGEPGRDRVAVHVAWEVVLLVALGALGFLLYREDPDAVRGAGLDGLLVGAAALGLLAVGASLALRAGVANLALGPVAVAAGLHYAEQGDRGVVASAGEAIVAAAVLGLLAAIIIVGFHVPGWAGTLVTALVAVVFIQQRPAAVNVQGAYEPVDQALYLFGGVAVLSILGGLISTIKPVRRAVGRFRPVGDPALRRGSMAGFVTGGALVLSTAFAAAGGVLFAASTDAPVVPATGLEWTGLALGAALLGGTSAFGRRGGMFGTVLAVALVTLFLRYEDARGWDISLFAIAAGVVTAGLIVTRLVETYGHPRYAEPDLIDEEWTPDAPDAGANWSSRPAVGESWSPPLPAQPTASRTDRWESDRWDTSSR
ncbi:ABC transporter permease [Actinomycetes bacterium KLBMP 9797]